MHRPLYVLDAVFAHVLKNARRLAVNLILDDARQRHATDRRQRLDPRRHVDAFAVNVVALDDNLTKVDTDPIAYGPGIGLLSRFLDRQGAIDGGDDAGEFDQRPITHQLELTSTMDCYLRIEDRRAVGLQPLKRPRLVTLHQAAIANNIGRQDRGEFTLHQR